MRPTPFAIGDPAPWFIARSSNSSAFHFNTMGGRYVVLAFYGTADDAGGEQHLSSVLRHRAKFDDNHCTCFGVSIDPEDESLGRVVEQIPGVRFFWDFDQTISRGYRAFDDEGSFLRSTLILDPRMRVWANIPCDGRHDERLDAILNALPRLAEPVPAAMQAPILVTPRVFPPELCRELIDYYDRLGGQESGFARDQAGRTVNVVDYSHKRRRDQDILDEDLRNRAMRTLHDRLVPEIHRAYQFKANRIERHIVACYEAETGGHFRPHRDNTTKGTAHRRFAVSLNLNTGEYEGGYLRFPEFGTQLYTAPAGGAVVFSCSLLHEATPVLSGKRYVYLPFLYDDAAAKIREANLKFVDTAPVPQSEF